MPSAFHCSFCCAKHRLPGQERFFTSLAVPRSFRMTAWPMRQKKNAGGGTRGPMEAFRHESVPKQQHGRRAGMEQLKRNPKGCGKPLGLAKSPHPRFARPLPEGEAPETLSLWEREG